MSFKKNLVSLTKETAWALGKCSIQPSPDDIFLMASRRGGSTWIMEVICANSNIRWVDQPFSLFSGPPDHSRNIPVCECSELICFSDEDSEQLTRDYVLSVLNGSLNINSDWRVFSGRFWNPKNRSILKIVQAKSIADWLEDNFSAKHLVLFRHPIAQAQSVIKAGWRNHSRAFLNHRWYREIVLGTDVALQCDLIEKEGATLTRYVLNWLLENLLIYRAMVSGKKRFYTSYEDCLCRPDDVIQSLAENFNLNDQSGMAKQMSRASRTTQLTREGGFKHSRNRLGDWMRKCSQKEFLECQTLFNLLDFQLYSADNPEPQMDLINLSRGAYA